LPPLGNTSQLLGPNTFGDTLNLTFSVAVNAVGFDVFPGLAAGNVLISVFSPSNLSIGSFTIAAPVAGTFFGVTGSPELIGRVNVSSLAALPGELVDNVAFGTQALVPEPTSLILLGTALALSTVRRRWGSGHS
jgi:hypothetical protein